MIVTFESRWSYSVCWQVISVVQSKQLTAASRKVKGKDGDEDGEGEDDDDGM